MANNIIVPIYKVVLDVCLLLCVGFPILFLFLWAGAFNRGFFCDDESLRHPYHESTVPSIYLYIFGIGMNCFVMTTVELRNISIEMVLTEYMTSTKDHEVKFCGHIIPAWMWKAYCVIGVFAFGAACSQLTTDVIKYTVGRLRPHFYTVCEPKIIINNMAYNCSSLPLEYKFKYHEHFECTNLNYIHNKRIMKEMRLSFPSGHSSFSMYTMIYFAVYLQSRMTWDGSKLLRHSLQFIAMLAAVFTGMTRISDYKHHWSDVVGGLAIGTIVAIIVTRYVSTLFPRNSCVDTCISTELNNLNGNAQAHRV